jgi:hypothetical protein
MTPKEKAFEILYKVSVATDLKSKDERTKLCSLLVVEEVRSFHHKLFFASKGSIFDKYLDNVKFEIEQYE